MAERNIRNADDPRTEILASLGLVTMLGAVMGAVIAVVALGQGSMGLAGILGGVAVFSFVMSLACFFADSNQADDNETDGAPLPFPSWLRTEADAAAEISAAGQAVSA